MIFGIFSRVLVFAVLASIPHYMAEATVNSGNAIAQSNDGNSKPQAYGAMELLTQTEGVDFNSYLRDVYKAIQKNWFAKMPLSVKSGQKGVNSIEFRVLADGTVPKEFVKMKYSSGKANLDEASLAGILDAAPFTKLPSMFSGPYIELRFTFYYNVTPPKP